MCILFFITHANPSNDGYKLILAANRDEYYARPALSAAAWLENPFIFGGRDMEPGREGGTWLAISAKDKVFKFGALLNITGENKDKNSLGRGNLVTDYVAGNQSNDTYSKHLVGVGEKYNGFNLVTIEISYGMARPLHCSNAPCIMKEWPDGEALGFGNSPPTSTLKKVKAGLKQFEEIIHQNQSKEKLVSNLMSLLQDRQKHYPDSELLRRAPNWCEPLSSIGVQMPEVGYGSRTRTVILIDAKNNVDFYEETLIGTDPINGDWKKTHLTTNF